jgi:hypothetical protein
MPSKKDNDNNNNSKSPKFIIANSTSKKHIESGLKNGIWCSWKKNKVFLDQFSYAKGEPVLIFFTYWKASNHSKKPVPTNRWCAIAKMIDNQLFKTKNPDWGNKDYDVFKIESLIEFKIESEETPMILKYTQKRLDGNIMDLEDAKAQIQIIMNNRQNIDSVSLKLFDYCLEWKPPKNDAFLNFLNLKKEITKNGK